ncbi:DNA/RNA nuclease SfsA [Hahella ganghwensis]|uniref:DNA/RNA nuclease SfsA n=1 Tax=Hahella ganghwensis TaxID=286420 RepID=UPI0003A4FFF9|nr:DNA/RNA nuclease SfsA [Hahella ganghwensis]
MKLELEPGYGRLIKRYKRFLADIELDNGEVITIHCPNTGSMKGCAEPGSKVYFSRAANPKRKYPYTWELSETPAGHWICVNTARPNELVGEGAASGVITELSGYTNRKPEVRYGSQGSRADWFLSGHAELPDCYVEVKNVTLLEDGLGYFPDAVSTRASKHLEELIEMVQAGMRAVLCYVVNHSGINSVQAAKHIDPAYAQGLKKASENGVEVIAYKSLISPDELVLDHQVPVII